MLDIKLIRKEREKIEAKIKTKEPDLDLSLVVELDEKIRDLKTTVEHLKALRNEKSKKVGELKQKKESADDLMKEVREIGQQIESLDHQLLDTEKKFTEALAKIPNIPADDITVSHDPKDNVVIKMWGEKPNFSFPTKHHLELNETLKMFDFVRAAKTSGTGWPAYRDKGAKLEWALLNYMLDIQFLNGFEFWLPPLLVRPHIMFGSGQIPKFDGQYYEIAEKDEEHKLYLIPTSEVVLNGLHYEETFSEEELPKKYVAFSPCFRREAGAAGKQERGLIRIHQFHKVEMFAFTTPQQSNEMMEKMIAVAEEILQGLNMHYRLTKLVTGDMSFTAAKTIDVEVWLPGQGRYYEVSSISNCTDYQARRSQIRYKEKNGKPELVHTLNGSGLATSRLMVALLENNQNPDGTVNLPAVLAERMGTHLLKP